ncbi:hypothetical protein NX79_11310 [Xanthomonas vasicola]|nr:hypothetical protein NX05_18130 [Xanthomonas vasicola]KGR41651.1 hypothetical protein NX04_13200 [Xanthomonas vasicola]KGR60288.1 hypothetical protein NX79_11310 [Xanthomonas vasicola]
MTAPSIRRREMRAIVWKITLGQLDICSRIQVAEILICKSIRIIFNMIEEMQGMMFRIAKKANPRIK